MDKQTVIDYFGSQAEIVRVLGVCKSSVSQWGSPIPEKHALLLEKVTKGALVYDPEVYGRGVVSPKDEA